MFLGLFLAFLTASVVGIGLILVERLSDKGCHRVPSPRGEPRRDVQNNWPLVRMDGEEQFRGQRYG